VWNGLVRLTAPGAVLLAAALVSPVPAAMAAGPSPSHHASHAGAASGDRTLHPALRAVIPAHLVTPSRVGRSIGSPTEGHLVGGARLEESPWLRVVPCYEGAQWGLESLVSMVDRAARGVRKQYPDSVLSIGHLSRAGGGEIDRHASHESGRDADVGFYIVDYRNKPIYAPHFVAFKGDGTAPTWPGAHFDDARNWAFIASILGQGATRVNNVFIAAPLRARLLAYAAKIGAPYAVRERAALTLMQPRGALPHDDHFHVRIGCPNGMEGCVELPTRKLAHGRPRSHDLHHTVNPPGLTPGHSPAPVSPRPPPAGEPPLPTFPDVPVDADEHDSPAAPPAILDSPIDDVDGIDE
jgi:penicillin-insensitive murein endopeptidase